jgi:two-component system, OmpR family, sensor histidine kinase MtrB
MAAQGLTLRGFLAAANAGVAVVVLLVCGALVVATTALHRVSEELGSAVESVRIVSDAESDLLLHARARDHVVKAEIEERVRRRFAEARSYVSTEIEAALLREAETSLDAYTRAERARTDTSAGEAPVGAAFAALDALVEMNVAQARDAQRRAADWDRRANAFAFVAAALTVVLSGALVWWMRKRLLQPVLAIADALARFARGERGMRLEATGPIELQQTATGFNEMADAIWRQRQHQIAFLGGVAHDLRTPLSALALSLAAVDQEQLEPGSRIARTFEVAKRQVTRLDRMVGDFLEIGRIEAGQLELKLVPADARELVEQVVDLFEAAWQQHQLELELPERPLLVRCDPLRIEQVVTNLISNALKYSPPGTSIGVALTEQEQQAVLRVVDHGIGITEEDRHKLFEPFSRVGLSKETVPGVGLGLFIVRRIVEAHGGSVEVESAFGQGSTFRIRLPLADAAPAREQPAHGRPAMRGARLGAPRRRLG